MHIDTCVPSSTSQHNCYITILAKSVFAVYEILFTTELYNNFLSGTSENEISQQYLYLYWLTIFSIWLDCLEDNHEFHGSAGSTHSIAIHNRKNWENTNQQRNGWTTVVFFTQLNSIEQRTGMECSYIQQQCVFLEIIRLNFFQKASLRRKFNILK